MASSLVSKVAHSKKAELKSVMGMGEDRICAVFIGSSYGPNLERPPGSSLTILLRSIWSKAVNRQNRGRHALLKYQQTYW